jgi:hypothetical protein
MTLCALLWAAASRPAYAQWQNGGSLTGQILDGDGAPVEHARLEIEETGTGTTYEIHTDGRGRFLLPQVAPGSYRIDVEAPGFARWQEGGVEVGAGRQVNVSPQLVLAGRTQTPTPQKGIRRLQLERKVLSHLKRDHEGELAVVSTGEDRAQIAEVREPETRDRDWMVFEPRAAGKVHRGAIALPGVKNGGAAQGERLAAETAAVPAKVHARVTVRTAQGMVNAEIAEIPIEVKREGDWRAFEPGHGSADRNMRAKPAASLAVARGGEVAAQEAAPASTAGVDSSTIDGDLPAVGSVYAPVAEATRVAPRETAKERRAAAEQAKLKELAAVFAPPRISVTTTATNAGSHRAGGVSEAEDVTQELSQFEPASDRNDSADSRAAASLSGSATVDELVAPERRRGDEKLHGQVFAEDRDKAWGSRNAFTTLTTQQADGSFLTSPYNPPDRRMQYGLELGGGVDRGRERWYVALDELTRNFPGMAVPSQPAKFFAPLTASELQTLAGRLGAGGVAISSGQAQKDYTQTLGTLTALLGPVARTERQTIAFPRFDWKLDERNRVNVGYDLVRLNAKNGMRTTPTATWGIGSFGTRTLRLDAISASVNTFVTANILNELRYTHAHDVESEMADTPTAFEMQFAKNYFGVPPEVGVASGSGGFRFGTPSTLNRPAYPDELRQEAADTLTWVHGRNQVDVGYALDYVRDHTSGLTYATGDYTYSKKEDFVADMLSPDHCDASTTGAGSLPCWSTFRQTTGPTDFTFDTADYAGFATDTLKLLPSLTLAVGARYDYEKLPTPNAALLNPDIPQTASLPSEGNVSPRVGIAWELPWSRGRREMTTVLRAGLGIFYGRIPNTSVLAALTQTGSVNAQRIYLFKPLDVGAPTFPYVFSSHPDLQVKPDATYFATGFQHPRAEQTQVSVEQSLGRHLQLTLDYWGSFGSQLPRIVDQNIDLAHVGEITYTVNDPGGAGPLPPTYTSKFYYQRLNPNYQQMAAMESNANARYQALGFSLVGRLAHAMAVTLGYRYAHEVDDNPYGQAYRGRWDVLDPSNLALEHGTSNLDIRDQLRGGVLVHEPWHASGWLSELVDGYTMAMTGSVRTGRPYTMRISSTVPSMSCSYEEWLQAGSNCVGIPLPGVITGVGVAISGLGGGLNGSGGGKWLPMIGRNTFRYPGTYNASLRMAKRFTLGGRASLLFQTDISNVLNHRNVTNIETMGYTLAGVKTSTETGKLTFLNGAKGHAAFGAVTNTNSTRMYTDRQIELIMKLIF